MAAPVVEATATTREGAAGTSHTVNLPSGITAGNLLVLAISGVQTSPVTTPSGWTLHSDANLYDPAVHNLARIYWRIADGNEGSTLSMTSSAVAAFGAVCYRISGATATNPLTALTYAKSNPWDGYPNPPLSSIGLQRDWLFVAGVIDYSAAQLMTGAPTGYSTMSTGVGEHNTGFHSRVTLCYKSTAVVASDDPGTFTAAAPTYWCAFTFAITPARTDSPVVEATAGTNETGSSTSHAINLPSGIVASDLLLIALSMHYSYSFTTPSGWTLVTGFPTWEPANHNKAWVYYRIADGNEGSTVSITSSGSWAIGAAAYRISGASGDMPKMAAVSAGPDARPDPPLIYAEPIRGWLYVAGFIDYFGGIAMAAQPSGYSTPTSGYGYNSGNYSRIYLASRGTTSSSAEDPGVANYVTQTYWGTFTLAIAPTHTDTFPVVVDITTGYGYGSSGSFLMPAGVTAGERLLALFAEESNHTISAPSGWTQLFSVSGGGFAGFYKVSDGSETGAISIDMGANAYYAYITYRIAGRIGTPTASSVWTGGENDAPNPPSLDPGVGAQDILWFAVTGRNRYSYTAGPTYYLRFTTRLAATNGNLAAAHRYRNASSEDPGTFTTSTNWYPYAVTLAFPPLYEITGVGAIASAEAFGTVQMVYNRELTGVGGIASAEAFGLAQVLAIKGATFPAISAFTGTHAWSVAAWAKWTSKTAGRVFSVWDGSGNELASLRVDNTASSANRAAHSVAGAANDGYYHLYVMTYDGVTLRFYIDGRAAGAEVASATSLAAAGGMRAGSGYQGATPFGGSVDDVAVFDYYLSASQVAGLFVSGTTSGVDLVHDSSGSSMVLAGWQPHAYMAGYAAVDTYSTAKDLTANGGCIAIPIALEGKMALRQVSLWNTDAATARSWNWSLYYQPRQDAISNTLFRVAAGVAADAFTPGAASKRSIAAAGAPTLLGPGSYWLVIQNNHATSTFGLGSIASGPLSINRAQTKTLTVPIGAQLDFTLATWTKVTAIYAVILEGDVLGLWGAY